jgi:outer membrane protein assembly factor BamB
LKKVLVTLVMVALGLSILTCFMPTFTAQGATNILSNAGFENGLTSWSTVPGTATYTIDTSTKHSGASSVMGTETDLRNIGRLYQDVTGVVVANQDYKISGWIKTRDVTGMAVIGLDYVTSSFYTPADGYVFEIGHVSGTQDWTYFESPTFTLQAMPSDASALYFLFDFNEGTGTAWLDDVALTGPAAATPAPSNPSESWYMFGHDLSGARYSTSSAPKTNQILWQKSLDGAVRSAVTISGSTAYTGCFGGSVYALDASNGNILWNYKTRGDVWSTPTAVNGMVYVGSNDWSVYAIKANTGGLDWSFPTGGGVFASPTVVDDVVYVGSTDNNMYALNANTGAKLWSFPSAGQIRDSAAVVNGVVYFGCFVGSSDVGSGNLYALNANTGTQIWFAPTGDSDTYTNSSPAVVGGTVYVGSTDHHLYAFRTSDGTQIWNFPTPAKVSSSPAVHNGIVYVGCESGDFYAINAASGTQVWSYQTGGAVYSSPAIADGVVYVGSYGSDKVYAFDAASGNVLWSYSTGSSVFSAPTVSGGVMFVGSYDNSVYAFGTAFTPGSTSTETGALDSAWAPSPINGAMASVISVGAVSIAAVAVAAATSVPATTASGFFDKLIGKVRELMPDTLKKWIEDFISSKRKLKIEEKHGSPFLPTKPEILVYAISILILTFAFAYVKVGTLSEFLTVLPTFILTSLIVGLVKTYLLTVYARKRGVWAEYKLWYFGTAMFLISTIAFKAPFSSPTRKVHHSKNYTERLGFLLSVTAIIVTLGFAAIFFGLLVSGFALIGGAGLAMCLISAFFETFPIKPMGGVEIYKYSKIWWAILFFGTLALYVAWIALLAG